MQKQHQHQAKMRSLSLHGHVGFDSLPDQLVNKSVSEGFTFNVICIGWLSTFVCKNCIKIVMHYDVAFMWCLQSGCGLLPISSVSQFSAHKCGMTLADVTSAFSYLDSASN